MTCQNFTVTAMYESQITEPFLIDLSLTKSKQIKEVESLHKDLLIKIRTGTVVKLLLILYEIL